VPNVKQIGLLLGDCTLNTFESILSNAGRQGALYTHLYTWMYTAVQIVAGAPLGTRLGKHPVQMTCPFCHQLIITTVHHDIGLFAWLAAGCLCIFG